MAITLFYLIFSLIYYVDCIVLSVNQCYGRDGTVQFLGWYTRLFSYALGVFILLLMWLHRFSYANGMYAFLCGCMDKSVRGHIANRFNRYRSTSESSVEQENLHRKTAEMTQKIQVVEESSDSESMQ
eukprot:1155115_1